MRSFLRNCFLALILVLSGDAFAGSHGTPYANTGSPLGANIGGYRRRNGSGFKP
jgi:hypothetical protein